MEVGEVAGGQPSAFLAMEVDDGPGNVAAIEGVAGGLEAGQAIAARCGFLVGHVAERAGEILLDEYLADLPALGAAYREVMGRHFPAMAVVEVNRLVEPEARLEIEATAVLP